MVKLISAYVASWALPNETFPVHLNWEPSSARMSELRLEFPSYFSAVDFFNVKQPFVLLEDKVIPADRLQTQNYFGVLLRCNKVFDDIMVEQPIRIEFVYDNGEIISQELVTRIVRPKLQVTKAPSKVTILDKSKRNDLFRFEVTHTGLGKASTRVRIDAGGSMVSHTDSLYFQILNDLARDKSSLIEELQSKTPDDLMIDPAEVERVSKIVFERLQNSDVPPDMAEVREILTDLLRNEEAKQRLRVLIQSRVKVLMIASILYFLDRNPHEDIELAYGKIKTIFQAEVKDLNFSVEYRDSIGNQYESVGVHVEIEDKRTNKDKFFEVPVNLDWKSELLEFE